MKGIILNLVEDAVVQLHGEATWDEILLSTGLEGAYTSLGTYPDADLEQLLDAGARLLEVDQTELTRVVGHSATLGFAQRYPHLFAPHPDARAFLLTLNEVIHRDVRKVQPDASPPEFWFDDGDPDVLVVGYHSARRLCALAEGMIAGAATHYGERAEVEHPECQLRGAPHCVLVVRLEAAG